MMPRLGALEITSVFKGQHIELYSKLKSLVWPDYKLFQSTIQKFAKDAENLDAQKLASKFTFTGKKQIRTMWDKKTIKSKAT